MIDAPVADPARSQTLGRLLASTVLDVLLVGAVVVGFTFALGLAIATAGQQGVALGPPEPLLRGLPAVFIPLSLWGTALAGALLFTLRHKQMPLVSPAWRWTTVLLVFAIAGVMQAGAVALSVTAGMFGSDITGSNVALVLAAYAEAPLLTLFAAVVVAPLGEELIFRRVLLHRFAQTGRASVGLIITSVGFALIHEPVPGAAGLAAWLLTLATYSLLGVGFGLIYLRTGRFDAAVLGHVLVNALGMTLLLLGTNR